MFGFGGVRYIEGNMKEIESLRKLVLQRHYGKGLQIVTLDCE